MEKGDLLCPREAGPPCREIVDGHHLRHPDQKQRNRMVKYLERFGYRCRSLPLRHGWMKDGSGRLCAGMDKLTQPEDRVKVYRLRGASETYTWGIGQNIETEDIVII